MRRMLVAVAALAVIGAIVAGLLQARGSDVATEDAPRPLSRAQVTRPAAGAPPALAALRADANALQGGGADALEDRLRALRGHPVVVNLWASWCDPCRFEMPFLQRQALRRGARVAFLGVNSGDERAAARRLLARIPLPYPSIEDPGQQIAGRLRVRGLPATAFYDARGRLELVHQGVFPSEARLAAAIDRYALGRGG